MYKPKILVVEDDPAITNLIRTTLDTQEYQYHTAKTAQARSWTPSPIIPMLSFWIWGCPI